MFHRTATDEEGRVWLQSDRSRPSVGVGTSQDTWHSPQEALRVAGSIGCGPMRHQCLASKKKFLLEDLLEFPGIQKVT